MIFRLAPTGAQEKVEMKDLRKGDMFYTVDGAGYGPVLMAKEDATLRPSRSNPVKMIWGCKTEKAS